MNIYNSLRIFIATIVISSEFATINIPKLNMINYLSDLNNKLENNIIETENLSYNYKVYNTVYNSLYNKVLNDPSRYGFTKQEIVDKIQMSAIEKIIHEIALYASQY